RFYNPEDDFTIVKYTGYNVNSDGSRGSDGTWTASELNEMDDDDLRYIAITGTTSEDKPDYFKTMFYRTYVGNVPEALQDQISQLPCWEMKHFAAEYISPYPYYGSGRSAVVIAKYYEGAKINGSVEFMGSPLQVQTVIRKGISLYGNSLLVDHDKIDTENGNFSLIAPAGNITLELRRYPEMGLNAFVMKTITLNSTSDPELAPITDDEAMRVEGTNFKRIINITVDPAAFEGYVYQNKDEDEAYNVSSDDPLPDVEVTLLEIAETDPETGQPLAYGTFNELTTDENGYYNLSGLMPGIYMIRATLDDFVIHENYAFIYSGNNTYNISKPKTAAVEGNIYFDSDEDGEYDSGEEEMSNVDIQLLYPKIDGGYKLVETSTTDASGSFSFTSLNPGPYIINASKQNSVTGHLDYAIEEEVALTENETTQVNISIDYATIALSGYTKHDAENIGDIRIDFSPDNSEENNTAEQASDTTGEDGSYEVKLKPGDYNITIEDTSGEYEATYSYFGQIHIEMGEGIKTLNILLTKETVTVSGSTTYNSANTDNVSILFLPDFETENNTAVDAFSMSDENGDYIVELRPGTYTVTVDNHIINQSGQVITCEYSGMLVVTDTDTAKTYDIVLILKEE
ncbi:MAG: hypothetical protein KAI20_01910, partial [Thermoplasmatales archaeon]|nr:hypothetical protein [Thermoplasmatales archaeon]